MYSNSDYGGEYYDFQDTQSGWTERDMELMIMEEERDRRERYAD